MPTSKAKELARKMGGVGIKALDFKWVSYAVFIFLPFKGSEKLSLGTPILILANDADARRATLYETEQILNEKALSARFEDE